MRIRQLLSVLVPLVLVVVGARGQEKPADIRIIKPVVDKAAGTVTLPGAFWNEHLADWLDVALCGRPSDFLHETVVCVTTTKTLLEEALREVGCRDGDAWVDNVKEFPRIRGDRFMVVLTFEREGKKEQYSLDELLTFSQWGVSMGPYGFMFKGDPDHAASQPATVPGGRGAVEGLGTDGTKILRDDPQMALLFRGIQSMSQSFGDHPLAYVEERWLWQEIHRGRNHTVLPKAVYDSNGKVPVTVTFKKVSEEQLLTESAKLWHDEAFKAYMLKQVETAKRIDKSKTEYLGRSKNGEKLSPFEVGGMGGIDLSAAEITRDYAALDAAWASWAVEHLKPETESAPEAEALREQAKRWGEFMALNKERLEQLALAQAASRDELRYATAPDRGDAQVQAQRQGASDRQITARSRAIQAENKQAKDYWQEQLDKIKEPKDDDLWTKTVRLSLTVIEARLKKAAAGVALGQLEQTHPRNSVKRAELNKALDAAHNEMVLAEARLALLTVEFEISKREGMGMADPDLPELKKQREALLAKIKELGGQ